MGKVLRNLSASTLKPRDKHNGRLFVDISESVHVHFREYRLVFSPEEYKHFAAVVAQGANALAEQEAKGYKPKSDSECRRLIQVPTKVIAGSQRDNVPTETPTASAYFDDRLIVEEQQRNERDKFHVHYRDLRLAFKDADNFLALCDALTAAAATFRQQTSAVIDYPIDKVRSRYGLSGVDKAWIQSGKADREVPIIISADGYLVDGHHRWQDAIARKERTVKAILTSLTHQQTRPIRRGEVAIKEHARKTGDFAPLAMYRRMMADFLSRFPKQAERPTPQPL